MEANTITSRNTFKLRPDLGDNVYQLRSDKPIKAKTIDEQAALGIQLKMDTARRVAFDAVPHIQAVLAHLGYGDIEPPDLEFLRQGVYGAVCKQLQLPYITHEYAEIFYAMATGDIPVMPLPPFPSPDDDPPDRVA